MITKINHKQFLLLIALTVILMAHCLLLLYYLQQYDPYHELHDESKKIYSFISLLSQKNQVLNDLSDTVIKISNPSMKITFSKTPANSVVFLGNDALQKLNYYLHNQHHNLNFSYKFSNNYWLNFNSLLSYKFYFTVITIMLFDLILFAILLFQTFTHWTFIIPLRNLKNLTENIGSDIHTPPLNDAAGSALIRKTTQAINNLQQRIHCIIDNRTRMLAAISHDLRTPITRLKLLAQFIDNNQLQEKTIKNLDEMEDMISHVLNFSVIDSHHEKKVTLDINCLLHSLYEDYSDLGRTINFTTKTQNLLINGRFLALKRTFTNLIENALKYSNRVDLTLANYQNKQAIILVEDEGPGIPKSDLKKVLSAFYRSDNETNSINGYGLGLTIAHEIINDHDGFISVKNRKHKGLRVAVILPLYFPAN